MSSSEIMTIDAAEALLLAEPQVGCAVTHHFGPGVYLRQVTVPAGAFAISHRHKSSHTNLMLAGIISMSENGGPIHVVRAPYLYVSPPGRKMGWAITEVVWLNIFATDETDVEKLEAKYFDKSPAFLNLAAQVRAQREAKYAADREDFQVFLDEFGITPYQARVASEEAGDQIPMPHDAGANLVVRQSGIEGRGLFTQIPAVPGDILAPARLAGKRTFAGRYANHSCAPNAKFIEYGGNAFLVATESIAPFCSETVPGDEVVVDYRQVMSLVGRLL